MPITDKRKRHKLMERAIRSLMSANLPPRFKFKDTYASIEVPAAYTQHLPTQQEIEAKFDELETQEEAVEAVAAEATVISKVDSVITSNLEVGTSNLFVDTETGNIGIGTNKPTAQLSLGAWASGTAGTGVDTQLLLSGPHNSGTNTGSTFKLKIEGYDNDGSTIYPIYCKDENSNIDFYIKNRPTQSGLPTMFFAGDLTVNGGITKTQYRPGEIIEEISSICDGSQIEVISGTYTIENVTGVQNGSTTHTAVTGSTISYTPPTGTKRVYYRFSYQWDCTENSGISHHQMQVDGTTLTHSRHTVASNYASTNWHHAIFPVFIEYTINCDASSTNAADGKFTSWTSPKTLRVTYREYSGSYESRLHLNEWWDGGGTDRFVRPHLTIRAIA